MGAGSRRGTILIFCVLECVGAGNVEGCSPYNSSRDYPGYNSKLGYNSIFFVFGIREGG